MNHLNENFILNKDNWLKTNNDILEKNFTKTYDDYDKETNMPKSPSDVFSSLEEYKNASYKIKVSNVLKENFTFYKSKDSNYNYDDFGNESQTTNTHYSVLKLKNKEIFDLAKTKETQSFYQMEADIPGGFELEILNNKIDHLPNKSQETNYFNLPQEVKIHFLNKMERDIKLQKSIDFHLKNNYPGKIPNISADGVNGALNKALNKEFGFKLKKEELKSVHQEVKEQKKSLNISK